MNGFRQKEEQDVRGSCLSRRIPIPEEILPGEKNRLPIPTAGFVPDGEITFLRSRERERLTVPPRRPGSADSPACPRCSSRTDPLLRTRDTAGWPASPTIRFRGLPKQPQGMPPGGALRKSPLFTEAKGVGVEKLHEGILLSESGSCRLRGAASIIREPPQNGNREF